jgi:hypothetical protein
MLRTSPRFSSSTASVIICFPTTCRALSKAKSSKVHELAVCATAANDWCASKRLQLNAKKTEVMWFGYATNLVKLASR